MCALLRLLLWATGAQHSQVLLVFCMKDRGSWSTYQLAEDYSGGLCYHYSWM